MTPFQLGMLRNYGITYDWNLTHRQQEATFGERRAIEEIVREYQSAADRVARERN